MIHNKARKRKVVRTVFILITIIMIVLVGRIYQLKQNSPFPESIYVQRVVDGDTFVDAQKKRYRLIGIDTPELKRGKKPEEPFAQKAKEFAINKIEKKRIKVGYTKTKYDRYKRLLVYAYTPEGEMLNELLLKEGLADVYRKASHKLKKEFQALEKEAKKNEKGMWFFKDKK